MNMRMKLLSIPAALAVVASLSLAACDNPQQPSERVVTEVEEIEEATPAAAEQAAPAAAEVPAPATDAAPVESVPVEPKSSEESVQPESETLFY